MQYGDRPRRCACCPRQRAWSRRGPLSRIAPCHHKQVQVQYRMVRSRRCLRIRRHRPRRHRPRRRPRRRPPLRRHRRRRQRTQVGASTARPMATAGTFAVAATPHTCATSSSPVWRYAVQAATAAQQAGLAPSPPPPRHRSRRSRRHRPPHRRRRHRRRRGRLPRRHHRPHRRLHCRHLDDRLCHRSRPLHPSFRQAFSLLARWPPS